LNIIVGYSGGEIGRLNLSLARDYALLKDAFVYIFTSMVGGESEKSADILKSNKGLEFAGEFMERSGVQYETVLSVKGFSPGEDIVRFAEEKKNKSYFSGRKEKIKNRKNYSWFNSSICYY